MNVLTKHNTIHANPNVPTFDASTEALDPATAASTSGTPSPIVAFKHASNAMSISVGSGVTVALALSLTAAELLYPLSVNTTLLAR